MVYEGEYMNVQLVSNMLAYNYDNVNSMSLEIFFKQSF